MSFNSNIVEYIMEIVFFYLSVINLYGVLVVYRDKVKAERREWRISERTLFGVALAGGAIGIYSGMWIFRHKTKHKSFTIGVPVILLGHIIIVAAVLLMYLKTYLYF